MTGRYWMVVRPGRWSPDEKRFPTGADALEYALRLVRRAKRSAFVKHREHCPVRVFVVTVYGDTPDGIAYETAMWEKSGRGDYPNSGRSIDTELQAEVDASWQHYFINNPDQKSLEEEDD